jgi:hypothetical protein
MNAFPCAGSRRGAKDELSVEIQSRCAERRSASERRRARMDLAARTRALGIAGAGATRALAMLRRAAPAAAIVSSASAMAALYACACCISAVR